MPAAESQPELFECSPVREGAPAPTATPPACGLTVTFDATSGGVHFEWTPIPSGNLIGEGWLMPSLPGLFPGYKVLDWHSSHEQQPGQDFCGGTGSSVHALVRRLFSRHPIDEKRLRLGFILNQPHAGRKAGEFIEFEIPAGQESRLWLGRHLLKLTRILLQTPNSDDDPRTRGRAALRELLTGQRQSRGSNRSQATPRGLCSALRVTINFVRRVVEFSWTNPVTSAPVATGKVTGNGKTGLQWELILPGGREVTQSTSVRASIFESLKAWLDRFPVAVGFFSAEYLEPRPGHREPVRSSEPFERDESPWPWVLDHLEGLTASTAFPRGITDALDVMDDNPFMRRVLRKEARQEEARRRQREIIERRTRERQAREAAAKNARRPPVPQPAPPVTRPATERPPLPPVPVNVEVPPLAFQTTAFPLTDLREYFLRERAARWWISNQSDDLLALPHCRIQRLEYQVRSALRVLGPMRGRALLSDEVGLGKTIEAGLVLKELLTRGLAKRFLVLTVPSLVDQWEEELAEKFNLPTMTTNQPAARSDPEAFWRDHPAIVASLHTLKQPAQLQVASQVKWDLLIVDEAHYLRNRESQAWQAVEALPRQFLLLLTATPVQNSLEDLYNLITLLQPGQLPSPKEFRTRFIDPKRPRQPREPEELRRLLGQVMIRNTRANAGVNLPPRRAETILFEPQDEERAFWTKWESELRTELAQLSASQSTLWGRLLLQAAGSSPAAWRDMLKKFPNRDLVQQWQAQAPLEASWRKKCESIVPLTRGEGGLVIFTQFLQTQAALAESLAAARVETFTINGATPAAERQPLTEEFRRRGGALVLTHSGTEGRNLQFCHRLVNFDLPWNPMEIEQRIGRLHRLGQQHPVRIYNLVQAGTLQEHLLEILQEKLNLFELVVGETGLILGERFSSDEFAEEILRRWRESDGKVAEAFQSLGNELAAARDGYQEIRQLDETLFAHDYESL